MFIKTIQHAKIIAAPLDFGSWLSNMIITIPRIISGLLLTIYFGSSKFGMP